VIERLSGFGLDKKRDYNLTGRELSSKEVNGHFGVGF